MRDFLNDIHEHLSDPDPVRRAQIQMKNPLPKRFYKDVAVGQDAGRFTIELDGRTVKTPARRLLSLPTRPAAELVAAEWRDQAEVIDPARMPVTSRMARSAERAGRGVQEVIHERGGLDRRAALGRHDVQRGGRVRALRDGRDVRGVGGIQHAQLDARGRSVRGAGDLGAQAGSPHAQDDRVAHSLGPRVLHQGGDGVLVRPHLVGRAQPADPGGRRIGVVAEHRRVARP